MFDVKVSASTPAELTAAIVALAAAMQSAPVQAPMAPSQQAVPAPAAVTPTAPAPAPAPAAPPVAPVTAAPAYNRDQIMTAGAALIDAGKINELTGLLGAFGVQAVTQLGQEQLGAFATELRKLGAQI